MKKNERFGFAPPASYSRSVERMLVLSLLATLSTIVWWLIDYHAEKKGLHLRYQANSIKTRRVISYLTSEECLTTQAANFKTNSAGRSS